MSQNVVNFSGDPSGDQLLDTLLTGFQQNFHTNNAGTSRPSYAVAHMTWTDTTSTPWVLKYFDGTDDIVLGTINAITNIFTPSDVQLNKTDATTAPTVNDDSGDGYSVGSQWLDVTNDLAYVCLDATSGAAVWKLTTLTTAVVLAGGTYTGKITTAASTTGGAGLNLPHGTAPTSPTNGDMWSTTGGVYARVNGATKQLDGSGKLVQEVNADFRTVNNGSATSIPLDNTIPQNTEGVEYMTISVTPSSASNILEIVGCAYANVTTSGGIITWALFQDSTADALAAGAVWTGTDTSSPVYFRHRMTAGTTSSTTFKLRMGSNNGNPVRMNGAGGVQYYGGVSASYISVKEMLP